METIITASEAAARLGYSDSHTRRCTRTYERVYGPIPKDGRGHRYYTESVIGKIEAAQRMVSEGTFGNLEAALFAQRDGNLPTVERNGGGTTLSRMDGFEHRLAQLEVFLLQDRQQLQAENSDLKRRVDYLVGELKRRDALEAPRRRWWRA